MSNDMLIFIIAAVVVLAVYGMTVLARIVTAERSDTYHVVTELNGGEVHANFRTYDEVLGFLVSARLDRDRLGS